MEVNLPPFFSFNILKKLLFYNGFDQNNDLIYFYKIRSFAYYNSANPEFALNSKFSLDF